MTELFRKNIDESKLPKRAQEILRKCDRLIKHYVQAGNSPRHIALFAADRMYLTESLKGTSQNIKEVSYKGFELV